MMSEGLIFKDDKMTISRSNNSCCVASYFKSIPNNCDKGCTLYTDIELIRCGIRLSKLAINEDTGKRLRSLSKLVLLLEKYEKQNNKISK